MPVGETTPVDLLVGLNLESASPQKTELQAKLGIKVNNFKEK